MKIIKKNLKKQELAVKIENLDDVWTLSQIIEKNDLIKGKTERKIKIGEGSDRNIKVIRKHVFLEIKVEKVELGNNSDNLKVLGVITQGPDDIPRGEHHSFNLGQEDIITIIKEQWLKYQLDKINESCEGSQIKLLMVLFDRETAFFAKLKGNGYEIMAKLEGDVQKKEERNVSKGNFYKEIANKILDYDKTGEYNHIVLASPGFWKESLVKVIPEEIKAKSITATISQATERAVPELLKRNELHKILEKNKASKESIIIDKLLQSISKDIACYGLKETKEKINNGAVSELLVSQKFLQKMREEERYKELESLMIACEQMDGEVHIISSDEAEKNLDSLTGIAGILRWKI